MTQAELNIYNFLAKKLTVSLMGDVNALASAIENGTADKRCIPSYFYDVYDIDKKEVIATVWTARGKFEWFKTAGTQITEYYRLINKNNWFAISCDLNTLEPIEYYIEAGNLLTKYDYHTNVELGHTTQCQYNGLPSAFQEKLPRSQFNNTIVYWAEKPYGRVIGTRKPTNT